MRTLNFDDVETSGGGGDFVKFQPGSTTAVYVLTSPQMIPNKFDAKFPKPACAVWNVAEKKVMIMDLKKNVLETIKLLAKDKENPVDWSRMALKIQRTGSSKDDTRYTVVNQPTKPLENYDKLQDEGNALLMKIAHPTEKTSENLNTDGL